MPGSGTPIGTSPVAARAVVECGDRGDDRRLGRTIGVEQLDRGADRVPPAVDAFGQRRLSADDDGPHPVGQRGGAGGDGVGEFVPVGRGKVEDADAQAVEARENWGIDSVISRCG